MSGTDLRQLPDDLARSGAALFATTGQLGNLAVPGAAVPGAEVAPAYIALGWSLGVGGASRTLITG
jgi:hypothetical protein